MSEKTELPADYRQYEEQQPASNPPPPGYPGSQSSGPNQPPPGYSVNQGYPGVNTQGYPLAYPQTIQTGMVVNPFPTQTAFRAHAPNDHMTMAILSLIFGFWPLGIFAILRASESRAAYARGDQMTAMSASMSARRLAIYSFIIGGFGIGIFIIAMIWAGVLGAFSYCYGFNCY